jgi:hypothetical protein
MIVNANTGGSRLTEAVERYRTAADVQTSLHRLSLEEFGDDAGMSKNAILQRAGTAMTSQANAMPQSALTNYTQREVDAQNALETAVSARAELAANSLNILNAEATKISALLRAG